MYWILHDPENFGYVALCDGEVAGIVLAGIEKRNENVYRVPVYIEVYDIAVSSRFVKKASAANCMTRLWNGLGRNGWSRWN